MDKATRYIGTSNIVVPGNKQAFPPEFWDKTRLHYYSTLFNSVEINASFYKLPLFKTFVKWTTEVNGSFRFTIKLSRDVTHNKQLLFEPPDVERFITAAEGLGANKGALLIQLPGGTGVSCFNQLEKLLECVVDADAARSWKIAVEFRNHDWEIAEVNELLDHFGASRVLHDIPKSRTVSFNRKAPFVYLRFHGQQGDYRGSYPDAFLRQEASRIREWQENGKDVFAYFNNTIGDAFANAISLKKMADL